MTFGRHGMLQNADYKSYRPTEFWGKNIEILNTKYQTCQISTEIIIPKVGQKILKYQILNEIFGTVRPPLAITLVFKRDAVNM